MSAAARSQYRRLVRELTRDFAKADKVHNTQEAKRAAALAHYKALQQKRASGTLDLKSFKAPEPQKQRYDTSILRDFFRSYNIDAEHGHEVAEFLKHQRRYQDLLERYNPGSRYDQQENVRLTAKRVGLAVPEN